jgi:general secretion pathway protein H
MELVIVLVLIGLSSALAAPSLSRIAKTVELRAAAQTISGILRYYRSEAVHKGKVQQILFDADHREVRVQAVATDSEKGGKETEERKGPAKKYALPEGIQLKEIKIPSPQYPSDVPTIEFYPNGGSNGGSVILEESENKGYQIKVNFLTGMVEIKGV